MISRLESEIGEVNYQIEFVKQEGYDSFELNVGSLLPWKICAVVMTVLFAIVYVAQESAIGGRPLNRWLRSLLNKQDLHLYLAEQSRAMDLPYEEEVAECDYREMTAKQFYNEYVKTNRPCLFKGYGKL